MNKASEDYPVWMGLGINQESKCITVLSFALEKEECRKRSAERSAEAGCTSFDVFEVLSKKFKSSLLLWLAENDVYGAEASEVVRDLGRSLGRDLKNLRREFIEKNDLQPRTPEGFAPPLRRSGKLAAAAHAVLQIKPLGS